MNDQIGYVLREYLISIPLFLVWLAGLGLAFINWRRSPKASGLMIGALLVAFVTAVLWPLFLVWRAHFYSSGMSRQEWDLINLLATVFMRFWEAVSWLLIIIAVIVALRRKPDAGQPG